MTDYAELKRLAEDMKGWNNMSECWPCDDIGPDWEVGRIDEEDERWPLLTVYSEQYDQGGSAPGIAAYYAAAHPEAILSMITDFERNQRMFLTACMNMGEIGNALNADMDCDADEMLGMVIDLKAQNARMLEWIRDISRTSGDKGAVIGARQLLKEFGQ